MVHVMALLSVAVNVTVVGPTLVCETAALAATAVAPLAVRDIGTAVAPSMEYVADTMSTAPLTSVTAKLRVDAALRVGGLGTASASEAAEC